MSVQRRAAFLILAGWIAASPLIVCAMPVQNNDPAPADIAQWRLASLWPSSQQPAQKPLPAVARVIAVDGTTTFGNGTMMSMGSGTLVDTNADYGLVITNWHVVRDAVGPVEVVFPDGFHSMARVVRTDREWDLASLLIWKPPGVTPVPVTNVAPRLGEMLTIAGYGKGDYKMQSGPCTDYLAPGPGRPAEIVELAAAARHGDSGGPILNTKGELAGVLFGEGGGHTDGSYGGRVQKFLELTSLDLRKLPASDPNTRAASAVAAASSPARGPAAGNSSSPNARFDGGIAAAQEPNTQADWNAWKAARMASKPNDPVASDSSLERPLNLPAAPDGKVESESPAPSRGNRFVWHDELKSFLAAFGVAAMSLHVIRWLAG